MSQMQILYCMHGRTNEDTLAIDRLQTYVGHATLYHSKLKKSYNKSGLFCSHASKHTRTEIKESNVTEIN